MNRTASWRVTALHVAAVAGLVALAVIGMRWIAAGWAPARATYPVQGVAVSSDSGAITWSTLGATGVDFAYLRATSGVALRDPAFERNLADARAARLRVGALLDYDLCKLASDQAALFVTTVPKDAALLPPAVRLAFDDRCPRRPGRALVLSELSVLLMQLEAHGGKPAVLLVSPDFEEEYAVSDRVARSLWLEGDWFPPDYAVRPWVMWTANAARRIEGAERPVAWVVVRP